jgi:pectate lyase
MNNCRMKIMIIAFAVFCICPKVQAQEDSKGTIVTDGFAFPTVTQNIPAFPTAVGFGKYATGGRGGRVVTVTNLLDDVSDPPAGSLRWAVNQYPGEPLTVVFNVSGWIMLKDILRVTHKGGITIAGQTSPGEGITLYPRELSFNAAENVIVRNIRVRCGSHSWNGTDIINGATIVDQALCTENTIQLIIDHCSFGWSAEEIITNTNSHFQTYSYNLIHEGLYDAGHHKGARSYGVCWGGSQSTFSHNMLTNCNSRSPRFNAAIDYDYMTYYEFVNNVNYNWGRYNSCYGGECKSTSKRFYAYEANLLNNYWKPGPATKKSVADKNLYFFTQSEGTHPSYWYVHGNIMDGNSEKSADNSKGVTMSSTGVLVDTMLVPHRFLTASDGTDYSFDVKAYTLAGTMQTADDAYQDVLGKVGCIHRDSIERRLVRECREGTSTFIGSLGSPGILDDPDQAEVTMNADGTTYCRVAEESLTRADGWDSDGDGMPDAWETANGFDKGNSSDGNYINAEGYTALEKYLCELMGEQINGPFGSPNDIRAKHTLQFGWQLNGNTLNVKSEGLRHVHLFSTNGICVAEETSVSGSVSISVGGIAKGVYILWATDSQGNRNAVKITL